MRQKSRKKYRARAGRPPLVTPLFPVFLAHRQGGDVRGEPPNNRGENHVHRDIHQTGSRRKPGPSRRPQTQSTHANEDSDHEQDRAMAMIAHGQRDDAKNAERTQGSAKPRTHSCARVLFLVIHAPTLSHERSSSCARSSASHQANHGLVFSKE